MSESNLGPKPDPQIEPGEPNPGGPDAVGAAPTEPDPVPRDLDPDDNPAVDDVLPSEMKQKEDTSTKATESDGSDEVDDSEEAPA